MRARLCTIDTGPLIALESVQLLGALSSLFATVLVPKAVREEAYRRRSTKKAVQGALREFSFFQRCDDYDKVAVDWAVPGKRDRGEAEAIQQAVTHGAVVLIDDRDGRSRAEENELECHGTLWVFERLLDEDLLSGDVVASSLDTLRQRRYRLPQMLVSNLLEKAIGRRSVEAEDHL